MDHGFDIEEIRSIAHRCGVDDPDNLPFLLRPDTEARGSIVLVHGLTATPWEMRLLAERLVAEGFCCYGLLLPGHGTTADDLARRDLAEWRDAVAAGVQGLRAEFSQVFGIGMSTGGLLLLDSLSRQNLAGLVLLSPFLRLRHRLAPLTGLLRHLIRFQERTLSDEAARHYYRHRPLHAVHQLNRLCQSLTSRLGQVTTPVLALRSKDDPTVSSESGLELFERLGSPDKELHTYDLHNIHVLSTEENPCLEDTLQRIVHFLLRLTDRQPDA
ncbi:MAG: hypothetical protein C0616_05320 [Desulfuromonas sp.]|nr:MAG: hypothetical protein C0616_05320 [Desulfuromonas sp.]